MKLLTFLFSGPVANWSSVVSGRKTSASDLFSVPNLIYPTPKPIPGTPHQLYPTPGSQSLQTFASSSPQSSPGILSSGSGSGSGSVSTGSKKSKSRRASGSSTESGQDRSPGQHLSPSASARRSLTYDPFDRQRNPSGEQRGARVTFAISGSDESANNSGSAESGFSEKTEKHTASSYADVCSKCMESMEHKPSETQRSRGHHFGYQTQRGQQGHQSRPSRGPFRGNRGIQRPQSAPHGRRYHDNNRFESYRGQRGRGQSPGQRGDRGHGGRNRGNLRLNSGHSKDRRFNMATDYQRSFSDPKPNIDKMTSSLSLDDKSRTSSARLNPGHQDENKGQGPQKQSQGQRRPDQK